MGEINWEKREAGQEERWQMVEVWFGQLICVKKMDGFFLILNSIVQLTRVTRVLRDKMNKFSLHRCSLGLVLSVCVGR